MYSYYIISSNIFILSLHRAYILLPELNVAYLMHIGCLRAKGFDAQNRFTKRFGTLNLRGFSAPNLFANRFDVLYPIARYHPIGFKCKIVGSGNVLEALDNGLRSDGLLQCIYSTFPHSILMI